MIDLEDMPKVELHLHLEGAIPLPAMWELVQRRGGDPVIPTPTALAERFAYRDFPHFIETWVWKNQWLDSYDAFEFAAEAVATDLAAQNIVYAEAFFSPTDFRQYGLTPGALAMAIRRGLDKVGSVQVPLIVDLVRETGPERARLTLADILPAAAEAEVIGIGMGGLEAGHPPEPFQDVYAAARKAGLRLTAHAGESAGAESVWGALNALQVDRVGHGIRSVEDPRLVAHLVERQTPLEVCPTSNVRTGVVADWGRHPVQQLIDAGALVTINTDDPAMFGCTLAGEYEALSRWFGYGDDMIYRLAHNAVKSCWAPEAKRRRLTQQLNDWWDS